MSNRLPWEQYLSGLCDAHWIFQLMPPNNSLTQTRRDETSSLLILGHSPGRRLPYFLEDFLGRELPIVKRYDAPDGKLYLETVFPLFWVEQKAGWSTIPAAIPTYLRIREVHKRAVEFIMDLDVHRIELRRQQIFDQLAANAREWRLRLDEVERAVRRSGGKIEGLPPKQTALADQLNRGHVLVAENSIWAPLKEALTSLRARVADLLATPAPKVGPAADDLSRQLQEFIHQAETINTNRLSIYNSKQLKDADIASLRRRIRSLGEDLQKNLMFRNYKDTPALLPI